MSEPYSGNSILRNMKRKITSLLLGLFCIMYAAADVTVEQCVALAQDNYPLIQKYDLLRQNRQIDLSDINRNWLPQIGIYAQGTVQNAVPSFPDALSNVIDRMGTDIEGLGKLQYKVGVDLNQTIWDGGASKANRAITESEITRQTAALDVELYAVRERVENLFFGILLIEEQIKQTELTRTLLESNLTMLRTMKTNGTATQSDVDMVEAELLTVQQQIIQAKSLSQSYRRMLGTYTGTDMTAETFTMPSSSLPAALSSARPELAWFDARMKSNDARLGSIRSSVMPRIGLFAQAYYGYPGYDYFKSMANRDMSFNLLAGVKISWNIGSFYTKNNSERKLRLANNGIAADREVFIFNSRLQTSSETARITELKDVMREDSRIVELRTNVRRAAESQLRNGVIDATALLTKITDENQARLTSSYHEIQLLQSIYQLKYILNR